MTKNFEINCQSSYHTLTLHLEKKMLIWEMDFFFWRFIEIKRTIPIVKHAPTIWFTPISPFSHCLGSPTLRRCSQYKNRRLTEYNFPRIPGYQVFIWWNNGNAFDSSINSHDVKYPLYYTMYKRKLAKIRLALTLSCTRYGMVISRWRIVHRHKGRCEDFDYYRSL
jgi:hypothetical protein